ncbi:head maturation protease, ClpP-related [Oceanobacillus kapialis]|uniref:ATP-dependent Clp protease proteolytic subunit n=1 Tax=Oceanobacillus kapialis TaxID=481353 RepID=A0ABW5PZK8_9BACI
MKHKITGDIVRWNSSIYEFNHKMRSLKKDEEVELSINSYGGDVFLGIDICNTLRSHEGKVTVIITGIAASAASIMCMGADTVKAYNNSQMMIHNAWTIAIGNAKKLRKSADDLDSIGESVVASYTHRIDEATVKDLLENETYLSASKAKDHGLIDEIINGKPEEVESEVFKEEAEEFNNRLNPIASASENKIPAEYEQMFAAFKDLLKNESQLNQEPPNQEPTPAEPKQNMSKLFLNLK